MNLESIDRAEDRFHFRHLRPRKPKLLFAGAPLAFLTALSAPGQESNAPVRLPEMVVTATRTEEETRTIPQSVTVVTPDELARRQPLTPNQMLREEPGIWSVQAAPQGSPVIRGQIGNRVVYLWDGITLNNGALFSGPNGYFNQFPVGSVDRIEVIRGPGSLQYGSGAIGGVINIISKREDFFPASLSYEGEAYARYGSVNDEFTETGDFWLADTNFNLLGSVTSQNVGDYQGPHSGVQHNTGFDSYGGNVNLAYRPLANHTLRLSWIYNDRENVDYYVQSKLNPSGIPRVFAPYERRGIAKVDYQMDNLGPLSSELKLYTYYQDYTQLRERRVETVTPGIDKLANTKTTSDQDVFGGGVQNTTPWLTSWGEHQFTYGLDYRAEDLKSRQALYQTTTPPGTTGVSVPAGKTPDGNYDVFDLFGIAEMHPLERWTVSFGGRYERTHLHSNPSPLDVIPNAGYTLDDLKLDRVWDSGIGSIGLVYNVTPELDLAANVASSFRAPTFSDVLSTGTPVFSSRVASVPSPSVQPEQAINYEFGPRYHSEHWNAALTAYWTELSDVVRPSTNGTVTIPGQGTFSKQQSDNTGRGFVRGIELAVSYRPWRDWTVFGNATYTDSWDERFHEHYRFTPPLNGLVGVHYDAPSKRWWAEAVEVLVDRLRNHAPGDEQDAGFSADPGFGSPSATNPALKGFEIPGYVVTNLRAGYRVWEGARKRSLELTLDINNLLNAKYREAYAQQEFVAPGINVIASCRFKF